MNQVIFKSDGILLQDFGYSAPRNPPPPPITWCLQVFQQTVVSNLLHHPSLPAKSSAVLTFIKSSFTIPQVGLVIPKYTDCNVQTSKTSLTLILLIQDHNFCVRITIHSKINMRKLCKAQTFRCFFLWSLH